MWSSEVDVLDVQLVFSRPVVRILKPLIHKVVEYRFNILMKILGYIISTALFHYLRIL
jgi:hypothetical protein